jgi:hypothetical protein
MSGIICSPVVYEYKGILFEFHSYCGPWPLKKSNHYPKKYAGKKFWDMWDEFSKLPKEEQMTYNIHRGGCQRI